MVRLLGRRSPRHGGSSVVGRAAGQLGGGRRDARDVESGQVDGRGLLAPAQGAALPLSAAQWITDSWGGPLLMLSVA